MKRFVAIAVAAVALVAASVGTASAVSCGTTAGLDTNEASFRGIISDDCAGVFNQNTPNENDLPFVINDFGSDPFTAMVKSDGGSVVIEGITFAVTADEGQTEGNWILSFTAPDELTEVFDLAVLLKAGNGFAAYLFEDESFTTNGVGEGTFSISFVNNGGQTPDLSHLSVLFRGVDGEEPPGEEPPGQVPNPGVLMLMGVGLVSMAAIRRRRAA